MNKETNLIKWCKVDKNQEEDGVK